MVDIDDVLLLRPVRGFALADNRPGAGAPAPASAVLATIYLRDRPFDPEFAALVERNAGPALASYQTEYAENDFPALPVRSGVHAFVWFARFDSVEALDDYPVWEPPGVTTHRLRLAPTARSLLR
jgi:hypothetical protein